MGVFFLIYLQNYISSVKKTKECLFDHNFNKPTEEFQHLLNSFLFFFSFYFCIYLSYFTLFIYLFIHFSYLFLFVLEYAKIQQY